MARLQSLVREFKAFILRGNILDLAVAVVIGVAFAAVVDAFTDGILMAFVAALFGEPNFDSVKVGLGDGEILVGSFLTALVNFLVIAAALFFVLKAASRLMPGKAEPADEAPAPTDEALLLTEIRDLLRVATRSSRSSSSSSRGGSAGARTAGAADTGGAPQPPRRPPRRTGGAGRTGKVT